MNPRSLFHGIWTLIIAGLIFFTVLRWAQVFDDQYLQTRFAPVPQRCPIGVKNVWTMEHQDMC